MLSGSPATVFTPRDTDGFAAKSAKPTNDNSPPIHRWVWDTDKVVVRAADG